MSESSTPPGETERWLPVSGFEGLYEVSDLGRVRSLDRGIVVEMWYGTTVRHYPGRILKPNVGIGTRGYPKVGLSRNSEHTGRLVHQLVMEAFCGPCPPGMEVLHGPGGKLDARLSNLRYGTRSENIRDRTRDGQDNRGERCGRAKLTQAAVADIRLRVASGETQRSVAKGHGVHFATVNAIIMGRNWKYTA